MSDGDKNTPPAAPAEQPRQPTMQEMAQYARAMEAGRLDAELVYRHLITEISDFEKGLDTDHEVALQLANFGAAQALHIRKISFQNPNMIEFEGMLGGNHKVRLVQHINQLNLMMSAVPPVVEKEAFRIGFDIGAEEGHGAKS